MKIAILSTYKLNFNGGGEKWIVEIANALLRLGHQVHVYAPEDKTIPDSDHEGIHEITYKSHIYSLGKKFKIYNLIYPLLHPAITEDYDVTYSTSFFSFFPIISSKNKFIIGTHDFYIAESKVSIDSFRKVWIHVLALIMKHKKMYIHSINRYITYQLKSIKSRVKEVTTFPYHVSENKPNIANNLRVLFIGRIEHRKGADLLLEYAKTISTDYSVELNVIGAVDRNYKKLVNEANVNERVFFRGFLDDTEVVNYLSNSDLLIFFSVREAFSLTVLEALYNGLPIVTTYKPLSYLMDEKYIKIADENVYDVIEKVNFFKDLFNKNREEYLKLKIGILERNREIYDRERLVAETIGILCN